MTTEPELVRYLRQRDQDKADAAWWLLKMLGLGMLFVALVSWAHSCGGPSEAERHQQWVEFVKRYGAQVLDYNPPPPGQAPPG